MFSQIDSFAKLIGPDKHARIVGGMCLMRLLLLYRDRAIRDEIRLSLPKQKLCMFFFVFITPSNCKPKFMDVC